MYGIIILPLPGLYQLVYHTVLSAKRNNLLEPSEIFANEPPENAIEY